MKKLLIALLFPILSLQLFGQISARLMQFPDVSKTTFIGICFIASVF